jgi:hypothetical protein
MLWRLKYEQFEMGIIGSLRGIGCSAVVDPAQ